MLKFANQDLLTELINVVDNFERAIKLDDNDEVTFLPMKYVPSNLDILRENLDKDKYKFGIKTYASYWKEKTDKETLVVYAKRI